MKTGGLRIGGHGEVSLLEESAFARTVHFHLVQKFEWVIPSQCYSMKGEEDLNELHKYHPKSVFQLNQPPNL